VPAEEELEAAASSTGAATEEMPAAPEAEASDAPAAAAPPASPKPVTPAAAAAPPASPTPAAAPAAAGTPAKPLPVRQYLDTTVVPVLRLGLRALVKARPDDPFEFLAQYLKDNNPAKK
jgi:protein dpy-30